MYDYLILRWQDGVSGADDLAQWLGVTRDGDIIVTGEGEISGAMASFEQCQPPPTVVLLAPAASVLLSGIDLPAEQRRHLKQVLPFLVEEKLVDDIEDVHIGIGPSIKGQPLPVAIVSHSHIISWLDRLYSAGLPPGEVVPEMLALPWREGGISAWVANDTCLVRDGSLHGMSCDPDNLLLVLTTLLDMPAVPRDSLHLLHEAESCSAVLAASVAATLRRLPSAELVEVLVLPREQSLAEVLATRFATQQQDTLDLLQGGYAVDRGSVSGAFNLRRVSKAFAACLLVYLGVAMAAGSWFLSEAQVVKAESVALYREWFPQTRRVFEPRRQLSSELARYGSQGGSQLRAYLTGLAALGAWSPDNLQALRFDGRSGKLQLELRAGSEAELDNLRVRLQQQGIAGRIIQMTPDQSGGVAGQLELASWQ